MSTCQRCSWTFWFIGRGVCGFLPPTVYDCPLDSHRGKQLLVGSAVPAHVVPPDSIKRKKQARSSMKKARIERTFFIGDALAIASSKSLRELHTKYLRVFCYPLLSLFWGRGFRPLRRATRTLSWTCKPLKRLDLNFGIITDPTECETLPRRSARRSNHRIVCANCPH